MCSSGSNRSYLLLKDLRLQDSSPSGPRLKRHFKGRPRPEHRLNRQEAKRIPWISRNFNALDGDRDGSVTLEGCGTISARWRRLSAAEWGRDHQADDANQPPERTKQEDASQARGSDQHDGGEPGAGFQQLLTPPSGHQWPCSAQHNVHLLGSCSAGLRSLRQQPAQQQPSTAQDGAIGK